MVYTISPNFEIPSDDLTIGKWEKLGGVESYVATPTVDYPKDKVLLFLPDVFGAQLPNAQVRHCFLQSCYRSNM